MILKPEPLTSGAFRPFGDVLEIEGRQPLLINQGLTRKYERLSLADVDRAGRLQISLYRSTPVDLPFRLRELERHPLASQAFVPLHARPFLVVVAGGSGRPELTGLRAFLTNGRQGVNLRAGVWHHHQLTLDCESDYLVLERDKQEGNLETCTLKGEVVVQA